MTKKAYVVRAGGNYEGKLKVAELSKEEKSSIENTRLLIDELVSRGIIKLASHPFKSSPFNRAQKTAKILAKGKPFEVINELEPMVSSWDFLRDNFPDAVWCETKELFENQAAGLLHAEGEKLLNCIVESISKISSGETMIFVTDRISIEAAMAIVSGYWAPPELAVNEGDIIVFNFSDKNIFVADNMLAILGHLRCNSEN